MGIVCLVGAAVLVVVLGCLKLEDQDRVRLNWMDEEEWYG